jgi:hypothetical protein
VGTVIQSTGVRVQTEAAVPWGNLRAVKLYSFGQCNVSQPNTHPEHTLFLDCLPLGHYGEKTKHIGSNDDLLKSMLWSPTCRRHLQTTAAFLHRFALLPVELHVVCMCNYGKHRSVAMATMLYLLLRQLQFPVHEPIHLNRADFWSKSGCGWVNCEACDSLHSEVKERLVSTLQHWWQLAELPAQEPYEFIAC